MDGLSNQEKEHTLKKYIRSFYIRKTAAGFLAMNAKPITDSGCKTVKDAFDCDRQRVETFRLVSGF